MILENIKLNSETGKLKYVLLHKPGKEVENMIPSTTARSLYSDILNLPILNNEYSLFEKTLQKVTKVLYVKEILTEACKNETLKNEVISKICCLEDLNILKPFLNSLSSETLADQLITGVVMQKDTLTKYLDEARYILNPLPNFFFMRDAGFVIDNNLIISNMANYVRVRETIIIETLFKQLGFEKNLINLSESESYTPKATIEGGDVICINKDTILVGMGSRTNSIGIDCFIEVLKKNKTPKTLIIQELPKSPESFIHLDMVFTMLDSCNCMVYSPIVLKSNKLQTIKIKIDNGKVIKIENKDNIIKAVKEDGIVLQPLICGGSDEWDQEREQWHSGTNFFTFEPGKIIGYARNAHTIEVLNKNGFEVIESQEFIKDGFDKNKYSKYVITIPGSELARGGGGARCMTMPLYRES